MRLGLSYTFARLSQLFVESRSFYPILPVFWRRILATPQGMITVVFRGDIWRLKTKVAGHPTSSHFSRTCDKHTELAQRRGIKKAHNSSTATRRLSDRS